MNVSNVSTLIAALSAETATGAITPLRLGNILAQLVAHLQNAATTDDISGLTAGASGGNVKVDFAVTAFGEPTKSSTSVSIPYTRKHVSSGADASSSVSLPAATSTSAGLMSASDKAKLDSLSSGGAGSSSPSDSYDHSGLESAIAALSNLIATTPFSGLASWFSGATTSNALLLAVSEKPIYVVVNKFNGKDKPCGILFNFCDDMGSGSALPHAMHQLFISNFTDIAAGGHDANIHFWHRWFNINSHHGTPATWTAWEQMTFGGGDGCTCVPVTSSANGLMLASDKSKLDRLAISSISLSGNVLTINGNSFTLTPVGSGGSTPSGGDVSLVYFGSMGTADGSLTASQARSEANSATPASLLATLNSTSDTSFTDIWNKANFFIVFPKGKYSSITANASTALGNTPYSLAEGTIIKSSSSNADYDIYFVSNRNISSTNTAAMAVRLS